MMNARNGPNQQLDPNQIMQQHMQQLNLNEIHRIQAGAFFNNPPPQQPGKLFQKCLPDPAKRRILTFS